MSRHPENQETEIGTKIRAIRRRKKLSLQELGDRVGLSRSFLSQMESGVSNASIGSLKQIANALGITLAELFDDEHDPASGDGHNPGRVGSTSIDGHNGGETGRSRTEVVRADRRKMLVWPGSDGREYLLTPDLHRKLQVLLAVMGPGHSSGDPYAHPVTDGEEFGFIIEGTLEVTVGDETYVLNTGDSIYFPSDVLHHMKVVGEEGVRAIWVMTPPSF
jgi:quercetin dioxygenase-like cupin family protein/DNA-binding XRE family transcriptional regulator